MSDTRIRPYMGTESYIFISYSHKDTERVLPILVRMQEDGYRIWYDEGIDPGTEWDENIASHIEGCGHFIAFMSQAYLESSNCKDELHYARDLEKKRLLVYLENIELPSGMRMRLTRLQNIHKYTYHKEEDFYNKLFTTDGIDECKEAKTGRNDTSVPAQSVVVVQKEPITTENAVFFVKEEVKEGAKEIIEEVWKVNWSELLEYSVRGKMVTIQGLKDKTIEELIIPESIEGNSVTKIASHAFEGCSSLRTVKMPNTITSLGEWAFYACETLKEVQLSEGITTIESFTFGECENLQKINLPGNLKRIDEFSFVRCRNLNYIEFPESLKQIEQGAFCLCNQLIVVVLSEKEGQTKFVNRKNALLKSIEPLFDKTISYYENFIVAEEWQEDEDEQSALQLWYEMSDEKYREEEEYTEVLQRIGDFFYYDSIDRKANHLVAYKWFYKAAVLGDDYAMCRIAKMHRYGIGVVENKVVAYEWYYKATEQGSKEAARCVKELYENRRGEKLSAEWYEKACEYIGEPYRKW